MIEVDDLVEPGPEEIVLPAIPPLLGPHRITLRQADGETESRPNAPINLQEMKLTDAAFRQMQYLANPRKRLKNQASPDTSRATISTFGPALPEASEGILRNGLIVDNSFEFLHQRIYDSVSEFLRRLKSKRKISMQRINENTCLSTKGAL